MQVDFGLETRGYKEFDLVEGHPTRLHKLWVTMFPLSNYHRKATVFVEDSLELTTLGVFGAAQSPPQSKALLKEGRCVWAFLTTRWDAQAIPVECRELGGSWFWLFRIVREQRFLFLLLFLFFRALLKGIFFGTKAKPSISWCQSFLSGWTWQKSWG